MHLLSSHYRSEFLAVPELVRFTNAAGASGFEATLLIKASTLTLKFLTRLRRFQLIVVRLTNGCLGYGVRIHDDPDFPAVLWSIAERTEEIEALTMLISEPRCVVFLFNELAVNVAWVAMDIVIDDPILVQIILGAALCSEGNASIADEFTRCIDDIHAGNHHEHSFLLDLPEISNWNETKAIYVTNRIDRSPISIFDKDEGRQQEEVGLWLIDNLKADGAVKRPQVHQQTKSRELADLLLSHNYGAFLFESKALTILSRESLPNRAKLTADIKKHLVKATGQLAGGLRNIRLGHRVTDLDGNEIGVERDQPAHSIVLVPDLTLLSEATEFGGEFLKGFCARTNSFLHILDPVELLRMVQAAEMIEARGKRTTRLMAFDAHLLKRFEVALELPTPELNFLVRFV